MKRSLLIAFVLLFAMDSASAQKAPQILVVESGGIDADASRLINAIKADYSGVVQLGVELPSDLSKFDAVMTIKQATDFREAWLDSLDQDHVIKYIQGGGRFYAEGVNFRNWAEQGDDTTDNQLWDLIGDSTENIGEMMFDVDFIKGLGGEFTQGLDFRIIPTITVGTSYYMGGMIPVLRSVSGPSGSTSDLAWRSPSSSVKAVLVWPIGSSASYQAFISRVVCTYFQLCQLTIPDHDRVILSIEYDPFANELHLPAAGGVQIFDMLGRMVFHGEATSDRFAPPTLSPSTYIVRWERGASRASAMILIR